MEPFSIRFFFSHPLLLSVEKEEKGLIQNIEYGRNTRTLFHSPSRAGMACPQHLRGSPRGFIFDSKKIYILTSLLDFAQ